MAVFVPVRQKESVKLIEQTLSVPAGMEPRAAAIDYLARPGGVLPKGTTVRNLSLEDGVLSIDFSPELMRFKGGSSQEALLFAALSTTVAHFDGVKAIQLLVQNRPISELGGHVDLSEPYPVSKELPEEFR
ncbi:MAG: GerMN domain-containing protein [Armatimonas sp.]